MTINEIIHDYIPEKIKNCPCCNSEAKIYQTEISLDITKIWISCMSHYCEIQTRPIVIDNSDALNVRAANILDMIKRWNRRVKEEEKK